MNELSLRRKSFSVRYKNEITAYQLLGIPLIHWGIFFIFALFRALYISFTDWTLLQSPSFVGFKNYIGVLFHDEVFKIAIKNTVIWTIVMTIGQNLFGFVVAYMLINIPKGEKFFTAALFWPTLVSAVIGADIQMYIFNPSPFGLMNTILGYFGIGPLAWFNDPKLSFITLMIYPFFLGFGVKMLIFLAGLKQIPKSFYEAAMLDGASSFNLLRYITLPLLKPIIFLNVILSTIDGFKILAPMQLITQGGPMYSTMSVVLELYNEGFEKYNMGYASAIAFILFSIILIVTLFQLKMQGEEIGYE